MIGCGESALTKARQRNSQRRNHTPYTAFTSGRAMKKIAWIACVLALVATPVARARQGWHPPGGLGGAPVSAPNVSLNSVSFVDGRTVWVAGKRGYLARSTDGEEWNVVSRPVDVELND